MKSMLRGLRAAWGLSLAGMWIGLFLMACGGGSSAGSTSPVAAWSGPQVLETNLLFDSTYPSVAVGAGGDAMVLWQRDSGGPDDIWGKRLLAGKGWQPEGTYESEDGNAQLPVVAVSGTGTFMAAWSQSKSDGSAIQARRWRFGSNPESIVRLNDYSTSGYVPSIAMDAHGNACVVWMQDRADGSGMLDVMASRYRADFDLWDPAQTLASVEAEHAMWPVVAMDSAGNAVVAWVQTADPDNGPFTLHGARLKPGGAWSASVAIGLGRVDTTYSVAYRNGRAMFAWCESNDEGSTFPVYCRNWETVLDAPSAIQLVSSAKANAYYPLIGMDDSGSAMLAWSEYNADETWDLLASTYSLSKGWSATPQAIVKGATVGYPAMSMNAGGQAALIWQRKVGSVWGIEGATCIAGSGWSGITRLSDEAAGTAYAPAVHIGASGRALATWYQVSSTGIRHIYANHSK